MPRTWIITIVPPLLLPILVAAVWHLLVVVLDIPAVLLPSPLRVADAMWQWSGELLSAAMVTAAAALLGLLLSTVGGVLVAMVFSQSAVIRRSCYPYAIFLQTVPIVAIAPLIVIWLGEGFSAVVAIAFIISLFPVITNATDGLISIPADLRELFRLHRATRWQTLWHLQLPAAVPRILTGTKIASGTAVLGAIVGEFFAGAGANRPGLGYLIFQSKEQFRLDFLFAAVFVCTSLGVAIFFFVSFLGERWLLRWSDAKKNDI